MWVVDKEVSASSACLVWWAFSLQQVHQWDSSAEKFSFDSSPSQLERDPAAAAAAAAEQFGFQQLASKTLVQMLSFQHVGCARNAARRGKYRGKLNVCGNLWIHNKHDPTWVNVKYSMYGFPTFKIQCVGFRRIHWQKWIIFVFLLPCNEFFSSMASAHWCLTITGSSIRGEAPLVPMKAAQWRLQPHGPCVSLSQLCGPRVPSRDVHQPNRLTSVQLSDNLNGN